MVKPKIALYWCASCGGCEEAIVDLAEDLLSLFEKADIVFWPLALDFKYQDVEAMPDDEISVTLISGAVRTDEQERIAKLLRRKSRLIIAQGSCAHLGGVVGLANFSPRQDILNRVYKEVPTVKNPQGILPQAATAVSGHNLELPNFHNTVKALNQVIEVDYYIPGCPPTPELIKDALTAVLENSLPVKGSVLAPKQALCQTCLRNQSKPDKISIHAFRGITEKEWDPAKCFLEEGIICLGPATRGGCQERCIKANMPCRGCFGSTEEVMDQGAKCLSFLASLIDTDKPEVIEEIAGSIPDPAGLFYRFSLATSILRKRLT